MIRPAAFAFNAETAVNNSFQQQGPDADVHQKALAEFDGFVDKLRAAGVDVLVVQDTPEPHTPDSIFPNNWISFHEDGTVVLYPMFAVNRRAERKQQVVDAVKERFTISRILDYTSREQEGCFLEGTGSMVLDRTRWNAYACLSPRTQDRLCNEWCDEMNYRPYLFHCYDRKGAPIYHTNVMMCVADRYVVICLESIRTPDERQWITHRIRNSNREVVEITMEQMDRFAGNMLQVQGANEENILVMSSQAFHSLRPDQVQLLESYNPVLHTDITTIETNGGGSARCMMAEIFLPLRS